MYDPYIKAVSKGLPKARIIIDRFHVAQLCRKSLVTIRKSELSRLRKQLKPAQYKKLKPSIGLLRKSSVCLAKEDKKTLETLFSKAPKLGKAYRLCQQFTSIYNSKIGYSRGMLKLEGWLTKVAGSGINQLNRLASTIKRYQKQICNDFVNRESSGFVEGFNNKVKLAKRRCYGIFSGKSLFKRLFLDTMGYDLFLANKGSTPHFG